MEKTIEFQTTKIIIHDYAESPAFEKFLRNRLSVWKKARFGGNYVDYEGFEIEEDDLIIHRGIDLAVLGRYFPNHKFVFNDSGNPCKRMTGVSLTTPPRDDTQKEAVKFLLSQGKYSNQKGETQRFLCLKPGAGKTYCAINYICRTSLIPVIIVDSEKLLKQWTDSFFKFTNITEEDIGIISGRISIDKLLEKGLKTYKVYIAMHQSLQSYCKNDWNVVDNLFSKIGIGVKIVDEAHAYWKNMFDIDVHTNIKNNLYLTATPFLSNSAEDQVYQNMVSYIVSYGYTLKFQSIYHNIFYVSWNTHPTDVEEYKMSSNYGFNQNLYNDYLLKEENYNDFLELLDILVDTFMNYKDDTKVAIVVNCNNMVQALYEHFTNDYEFEGDIEVGRFCGLIKKKEDREKELEKKLIITTIKSFNKGVDVDNLSTVINTVSISSKTMIDQLSGRLRYSDKYKSNFVDITDVGFEACRRHLRTRTKFLDKIAKKSIECEF